MKLENIASKSLFIAPKVYGFINKEDCKEIIKIKGAKNLVSFNSLSELLIKNKELKIKHVKWYRNRTEGNIEIINEIYTLMVTENKRKLIYDQNNRFIDTVPFKIQNQNLVN